MTFADLLRPQPGFNESQTLSVQYGGFLEGVQMWDCKFFGVANAEAACMDPQQRCVAPTMPRTTPIDIQPPLLNRLMLDRAPCSISPVRAGFC